MNILLFTLEYPPFKGGIANYYGNLVKYWPLKQNIAILDNNSGQLINQRLPLIKWWPAFKELRRAIKEKKIDYIIVGNILPLGTVAYLIFKIFKIKYAVILHGLDFSYAVKKIRKRLITKYILRQADKIVCGNNYTAKLVKKFINKNVFVVNPGIEATAKFNQGLLEELKIKYRLTDKIVLLSVGRLVKRKGFSAVMDCLPDLLRTLPNLFYVILGAGPELDNLQNQINNLKLNNQAVIITNANDNEKNSWYNICDLFIMPAKNIAGDFEGFGIVYLEANLAGKPVIAGNSGGISDAVINGLNGLLVNPESNKEISQAMIKLLSDKKLSGELGQKGRERALNEFSWLQQINKLYGIINNKI